MVLSPTDSIILDADIIKAPVEQAFSEIIDSLTEGKNVTRKEWKDKRHYILLKDDILQIHKAGEDGKTTHPRILSGADLISNDWYVL